MSTIERAKHALWKKSGLSHDKNGYVDDPWKDLVDGVRAEMIESDYCAGSGQEWLGKIRAIHSSLRASRRSPSAAPTSSSEVSSRRNSS